MKGLKFIFTVLVTLAMVQYTFGQNIAGSAHDFSDGELWNTTGKICIVCHTPHNADATITDAPLWNHQTTSTVFTLYSGATFDADNLGGYNFGQPDGSSKLCLSCHDGTIALENFSGTTTGTNYVSGADSLGTTLADDHPISFDYTAALATADGELYNPTTQLSGISSSGTIDDDMLFSSKMQCASCHDVHGTAFAPLLHKSNAASALCLTCHNK